MESTKFYTIKSLSELLQVSTKTIQREITEKRLSCKKIRGAIRISDTDLNTYLEQCQYVGICIKPRKPRSANVVNMSKSKIAPHVAPYKLKNMAG